MSIEQGGPLMFGNTGIYTDPPVELSAGEMSQARAAARKAAKAARRPFPRARGQYRRYRQAAGATYLDWPRWRAVYLRAYHGGLGIGPLGGGRSGGGSGGSGNEWGSMPFGGDSF